MEFLYLFLLLLVCAFLSLIIHSKNNILKHNEKQLLKNAKEIDYLQTHQSILIGEMNIYKERIEYLLKELESEPDEILFKIESVNKESRFSNQKPNNPNEVISVIYHGYKTQHFILDKLNTN